MVMKDLGEPVGAPARRYWRRAGCPGWGQEPGLGLQAL